MEVELEKPPSEFKSKKFWTSILAEFLGTAFLVYIVSSVSDVSPSSQQTNDDFHKALAYGLGTATLVHWTEGLLNPALTVAFTSTGKLSLTKGVLYIIMEIIGGIAGAALTYALTPSNYRAKVTLGDTVLVGDLSAIQGLFVEFILTFLLTLTVYAAKDPGRKYEGYDVSIAYGFAVTLCHLVGYRYTFCGINPARSFGPAVVREIYGIGKPRSEWECHWIYWIGPIGGSLLAGVLYHFLYSQPCSEYNVQRSGSTRSYRQRESETIL